MTPEEFSAEADGILSPAVESLVKLAFDNVPPEHVGTVVGTYLDIAKEYALAAVRDIIADARPERPS